MSLNVLFNAMLTAAVGMLEKVGFEEELKELKKKLTGSDEKKRERAFDDALKSAISVSGDEILPLLDLPRIQEEIISGLMDPAHALDISNMADLFGDRYPLHARSLRKFFTALENTLLQNETWGPILERFQTLRFRKDVLEKLKEKGMDMSLHDLAHSLNACLAGSGAIAQEGGTAAGAGGIAVGGNVDNIVQLFIENLTLSATNLREADSLRGRYLMELTKQANLLPWRIVNIDYADPDKGDDLSLADIYTELDTMELRDIKKEEELREFMSLIHEKQRIPAQEVANSKQRLIVLGDPGTGKSTFMRHLAYIMAQACLAEKPEPWLAVISPWSHGLLLPVYIELRNVAAFIAGIKNCGYSSGRLLKYIHHMLKEKELDLFWPELDKKIREDGCLLFLLDGLDEVPAEQREVVTDMVNDFSSCYNNHRYLVTCRPYAYVGQPCLLRKFYEVTLAPFNETQINRFVENWYEKMAKKNRLSHTDAVQQRDRLQNALRDPKLQTIAERPLLLTVTAQLHTFRGKLPEDKTELYADAIKLLLERWEWRFKEGEKGIIETINIPGLKMSDLEAGLYEVAYKAHLLSTHEKIADIKEADLRAYLKPYLDGDWNKAGVFMEYIRERAGLLIRHKTDAYTFPHRTFQEFLAACFLANLKDYPMEVVRLIKQDMARWREVFLLSAGHSARTHRLAQAIAAVNELCPRGVKEKAEIEPQEWRTAQLSGDVLLEIGLVGVRRENTESGNALLERVQGWLTFALRQDNVLSSRERAAAGRTLSKLGDIREEVLVPDKIEFCEIPAGHFIFGEDVTGTSKREKSKQQMTIPYDYRISRFPVTNAQFRAFIKAGGYREARYWKEADAHGYWRDGKVKRIIYDASKDKLVDEFVDSHYDFGEPFNLSNHPVVGVTWYEALAFTRWFEELLRSSGLLSKGWRITLPSDAEWEKAARGTDGRTYPWGNDPDSNRANYNKSGIDTTSAVGCFPGGKSSYNVEEMSGNVWEWTRSLYDGGENLNAPPSSSRVLRGGSFSLYG